MSPQKEIIANRYEIISQLGQGGMGTVYEVYDQVSREKRALKLLSQKLNTDEALMQFKQEFWFMTRLQHANIIQVYEYGVLEDQKPFITMEIVPGQELIELGTLDEATAYPILMQTARALGFIHSRQLVHSDIKPENLRLRPDGSVKLMDFGLMQAMGTRSTGQLTGTVAYMPPEVPQRGLITEASDIYSLGVMAFELLTGQQPFQADSVLELIKAHISAPIPLPRTLNPEISEDLQRIILKMMAKSVDDRYQNTAELLSDLAQASGLDSGLDTEQEKTAYLSSHVLVARDQELSHLDQALEALNQKESCGVLIGAPAGVGKSRLIEEFNIQVQLAEIPFCQGICVEQGMSPYEPMIQALNQLIPHSPPQLLLQYGPVLAHLLPRLTEQGIRPQANFDPINQKITLFEHLTDWLKAIAKQRPLVLFVDDLHWADMATLELFNYCVREVQNTSILMLGSFRDDEIQANSPLWQLIEEAAASFLKLQPFSPEQTSELIEKMLRDVSFPTDFIDYFYGATSGNAFFIREMLRYLMEENLIRQIKGKWLIPDNYPEWELPTSIGDTIKHRLKRLSETAVTLIQQVAVVGKRIEFPLLQQLFAREEGLFDTLEELIERQFLTREPEAFVFPHDRVRETLYQNLDTESRRNIHQKVGEWLEAQGEAIASLAYHFKNGRDRVKAMTYLMQAGSESSVRMEATQLMHESLQILETLKNLPGQSELLETNRRILAWVSYMIHPFICAETNEKLIQSLQAENIPLEEQIEFESILISSYTMIGRNRDAMDRAQSLLKQLEPETVPYALILFSRLNALLTRGEFRQLVTEMEIAATIFRQHLKQLPRQLVWAYAFCSFIREDAIAWLGETVGLDDYAEIPREIGQKHDFLDLIFWSYYPEVVRNALIGRYYEIKNQSDEIFTLIKKMGRPIQHENRFQICLAFAAIEHGNLEEGEVYAQKVVALGERMQNPHQQASGRILQGMIAEQRNHLDDAVTYFSQAVELSRQSETDQLLPGLYRLAGVYLRQKQTDQAATLIAEALDLATGFRLENPYHQIHIYRLHARQMIQQEGTPDAIDHAFQQSISLAEATGNHLQLGLGRLAYTRWLGEHKRFEEARHNLATARKELGMIRYQKGLRQIQELESWLRKEAHKKPAAVASDSEEQGPGQVSTAMMELLPPQQAQELGYQIVQVLQRMNLEPHTGKGSHGHDVKRLAERLQKVERVNQFSQLIMKSLDLQLVLRNILDYVIDIAKADRGLLMLRDEQGNLSIEVVRSAEHEPMPKDQLLSFSKSFTQKVIDTGQPLWIQDAQSDQEFARSASIMALDLRTIICVPLKREKQVIGLIYLDRQAINKTFAAQDLELVESMATFASISLINAKLHAQIQERNTHLQMLNDLSRKISTTVDFQELLHMVLNFCLQITQAEIGYIFIATDITVEPQSFGDLICQASIDRNNKPLEEIQVSQTSIVKVLENKQALCIVDMQDEAQLATQKSVMALDLKSLICVPIYGKEDQILGVVYVSSQAVTYTFTSKDKDILESIIRQVGMDIENRHLMDIRKKQELMNQELSLARNIQSSMLPDYIPDIPSLDIIGYSAPAEAVGGDYYDYFKISDFEFGLAIGDVNGHGISAALLMSMAKSCLFVQGKIDPSVLAVMTALNGMIFGGTKERLFMTFVYSIFNLLNNTVTLSSAGHHLPYHFSAKAASMVPVQVRPTYPLGVREQVRFNELTVQLEVNDVLVYYTDGIVEAHTPDGEEFGFERLEALILKNVHLDAASIQEVLIQAYEDWIQGDEPEDDMTLVVVKARSVLPEQNPLDQKTEKKLKTGFLTLINR